jgi:hypothetical protein
VLEWAVEIDGEVLINDTNDKSIDFGQIYDIEITQLAGMQLLAKIKQ